jgi:hypothetical protein
MDPLGGIFVLPSPEELQQAKVIVCQCFVAEYLELIGKQPWTHLFVDESSQAMFAEAFVPIMKVRSDTAFIFFAYVFAHSPFYTFIVHCVVPG